MLTMLQDFVSTQFGFSVLMLLVMVNVIMGAVAYAILLERKIAAWVQDRHGPNRVGPGGLLQPIADGLKFVLKEDIIPGNVDRGVFVLAPVIALIIGLLGFAVIPFGGDFRWPWMNPADPALHMQVATIDVGLLYIVAVASLGVYSVVLGGWSSNNKFAFYGGLRAAAQMLSYEVPLGLCLLVCILATGSLRLEGMVEAQMSGSWTVFLHPFVFVIFILTALAEANRAPFDLAECEQELVGGYHTEYSSMKMALFFLGEYAHMITSAALITSLYLGGWEPLPWSRWIASQLSGSFMPLTWIGQLLTWINTSDGIIAALVRCSIYFGKIATVIAFYMLVRWSWPRPRFDQLMSFAWKSLVPASMALLAWSAVLVFYGLKQNLFMALLGNVAILLACGLVSVLSGRMVGGRQANLPSANSVRYASPRRRAEAGR